MVASTITGQSNLGATIRSTSLTFRNRTRTKILPACTGAHHSMHCSTHPPTVTDQRRLQLQSAHIATITAIILTVSQSHALFLIEAATPKRGQALLHIGIKVILLILCWLQCTLTGRLRLSDSRLSPCGAVLIRRCVLLDWRVPPALKQVPNYLIRFNI